MVHRSWHVREGATRVLLQAMLTCGDSCIMDLIATVGALAPLLNDKQPKVRYAAMEAFAVLQDVTTRTDIMKLIKRSAKIDGPIEEQLKVGETVQLIRLLE